MPAKRLTPEILSLYKTRGPLTYQEFVALVQMVEEEKFTSSLEIPMEFALERKKFQEEKTQRLLSLAARTAGEIARRKESAWRRQLERFKKSRLYIENQIGEPRLRRGV